MLVNKKQSWNTLHGEKLKKNKKKNTLWSDQKSETDQIYVESF